jgi:hypothetical protein
MRRAKITLMRTICVVVVASCCVIAQGSYTTIKLNSSRPTVWRVEGDYVRFKGNTDLIRFANSEILKAARASKAEFLQTTKELRTGGADEPVYALFSGCAVDVESPRLISVHFSNESDVGRAHPYRALFYLNFGYVHGKPQRLKLRDIVTSEKGMSPLVEAGLRREAKDRGLPLDFIRPLHSEEFECFVITRKGLSYMFAQDAYAGNGLGYLFSDVPWRDIKNLRRNGPIAALLRKQRKSSRRSG